MESNISKGNSVSFLFHLFSISITISLLLFFILKILYSFCPTDPSPHIIKLEDLKNKISLSNNTKDDIPIINQNKINVGISLLNFDKFDIINDEFIANIIVWFEYKSNLALILNKISEFEFERALIISKSQAILNENLDNIVVSFFIKLKFKSNLNYSMFPYQDHIVNLSLINRNLDSKFIFESNKDNIFVKDDKTISSWSYYGSNVLYGYDKFPLENLSNELYYPKVVFQIKYFYNSLRDLFIVLLPLIFHFLIELFSFSIDQSTMRSTIISFSSSDFAAIFAYKFVIDNLSPKVGYFMLSDYIFFIFLTNSFLSLALNGFGPYMSLNQRRALYLFMQIFVIFTFYYILFIKNKCISLI